MEKKKETGLFANSSHSAISSSYLVRALDFNKVLDRFP